MIWLPFFIFHIWLIRRNFQTLSILGLFFRGILRNPSQLTPRRTSGLEKRHTFQKGTSWKPQKSWKLKVRIKKIHVNSIAILSHEKNLPQISTCTQIRRFWCVTKKRILTARPLKWKITFRLWSPVRRSCELGNPCRPGPLDRWICQGSNVLVSDPSSCRFWMQGQDLRNFRRPNPNVANSVRDRDRDEWSVGSYVDLFCKWDLVF